MNSHRQLASLYEEWRLMSEAEGDAIRSLAWQRVNHCQNAKAELRNKILNAIEGVGCNRGNAEELQHHFRPVLEHLMSLEVRNGEWLAAERQKLDCEQDELNRRQRSIRQLRGSYGRNLQNPR